MRKNETMRPRTLALAILVLSVTLAHAQSRDRSFGLGFILGEPTGLSVKGYISDDRAIAGGLAWSLQSGNAMHVHVDYLFHSFNSIKVNKGRLPLYYGPGVRLRTWSDGRYWNHGEWHDLDGRTDLAVRFPVGLAYEFEDAPLDVFLEVVPAIGIIPSTYFDMDGGLGMRFWF